MNLAAVPALRTVDLTQESANAWLVANAPFTRGDYAVGAESADATMAATMQAPPAPRLSPSTA